MLVTKLMIDAKLHVHAASNDPVSNDKDGTSENYGMTKNNKMVHAYLFALF